MPQVACPTFWQDLLNLVLACDPPPPPRPYNPYIPLRAPIHASVCAIAYAFTDVLRDKVEAVWQECLS